MFIHKLLDKLELTGGKKTNRELYYMALLFHTSVVLNTTQGYVRTSYGKPINFFGFSFSPSGSGKNWSEEQVGQLFPFTSDGLNEAAYVELMKKALEIELIGAGTDQEEAEGVIASMPKNIVSSTAGTQEGLLASAYAVGMAKFGSYNLYSSEIGDEISDGNSVQLINRLKDLSEGLVRAKNIKSENVASLKGVSANGLIFGSLEGFDKESRDALRRMMNSGIYRRVYAYATPNDFELVEQHNEVDLSVEKTYIEQLFMQYKTETNRFKENYVFESTPEAIERMKEINTDLINKANEDKTNKYLKIDTGATTIIFSVAHLIAFLESSKTLQVEHLDEAYRFFKQTRGTIEKVLNPSIPFVELFELLILVGKPINLMEIVTKSYLSDFKDTIKNREELIESFKDYTIYKGMTPVVTGDKIKTLSVVEPEKTMLDKMIVSIDVTDYERFPRREIFQAISFAEMELSFFDNGKNNHSVEKLIQNKSIHSFCVSRFEPSKDSIKFAKDEMEAGHRRKSDHLEGANLIVFDIDNGLTIVEAQELLKDFVYLMYTSRSHHAEKDGVMQGDRFRIIMPTKSVYNVDPERFKKLYQNIEEFLGLHSNDPQTRNSSRLWFINPDCEIYKNTEGELLDVTSLIPGTEVAEKLESVMQTFDIYSHDEEDIGEVDRRTIGYYKYALNRMVKGDRNGTLYAAKMFFRDLGEDPEHHLRKINAMSDDPLPERELEAIIKRR